MEVDSLIGKKVIVPGYEWSDAEVISISELGSDPVLVIKVYDAPDDNPRTKADSETIRKNLSEIKFK